MEQWDTIGTVLSQRHSVIIRAAVASNPVTALKSLVCAALETASGESLQISHQTLQANTARYVKIGSVEQF